MNMENVMDHLFEQMERLSADGIEPEALTLEVERAKAMNLTARTITDIANSALQARRVQAETQGVIRPPSYFLKGADR